MERKRPLLAQRIVKTKNLRKGKRRDFGKALETDPEMQKLERVVEKLGRPHTKSSVVKGLIRKNL